MTFTPAFRQRLTACVAIVAVLLLFVAPMVSKTLLERQQHAAAPSAHSAMMMAMPEQHHAMMMADEMPGMAHHQMTQGEFACGYCDLLVHVPLLLWVFVPFIWLMLVISRAPPLRVRVTPVIRRFSGLHRPRAPPCTSSADCC